MHPRDVWYEEKFKFEVPFNKFNQPIRKGGSVFIKFLGEVARKGSLCPIRVTNWRNMIASKKTEIVELVRVSVLYSFSIHFSWTEVLVLCSCINYAKFILKMQNKFIFPEGKVFDDAVLRHVGKHFRQNRFELKAKYFHPKKKIRQEIENDVPHGHSRENWQELVDYWYSDKSKVNMFSKKHIFLIKLYNKIIHLIPSMFIMMLSAVL